MERLWAGLLVVTLVLVIAAASAWLATRSRLLRILGLVAGLVLGTGVARAEEGASAEPPADAPEGPSLAKLTATKEWRGLVSLWAKLDRFDETAGSSRDWEKNRAALDRLEKEVDAGVSGLSKLASSSLVTGAEASGLEGVIRDRYQHMRRVYSGRTCYRMTIEGSRRASARRELEDQLDVLERLHREGTLGGEAYTKARGAIERNLRRLGVGRKGRTLELVLRLTRDAAKSGGR